MVQWLMKVNVHSYHYQISTLSPFGIHGIQKIYRFDLVHNISENTISDNFSKHRITLNMSCCNILLILLLKYTLVGINTFLICVFFIYTILHFFTRGRYLTAGSKFCNGGRIEVK